jgi:hypothetical protein
MKTTLIAILFAAPVALAADQVGRFDAGTSYEPPALHAPANVSRMFTKAVPRTARTASVNLPASGGSNMIIWTISSGSSVTPRVITPNGAVRRFRIEGGEAAELDLPRGAHDVVHVSEKAPATYRVDLDLPADIAGVTVVAAEPESAITLSTWAAPLSRQPGQPVTLHAELRDGNLPIAGAHVVARLAAPNGKAFESIELVDQGNGIYRVTLEDLPANIPGGWQVRFEAEGTTANAIRFARTGMGELVAERGSARLDKLRTEVVDDRLRVTVDADVRIAGAYRLDVILAGPESNGARANLAWAEGARQLDKGAETLTIDLPLALIGDTKLEDLFLDVRLLGLDTIGVADRITLERKK